MSDFNFDPNLMILAGAIAGVLVVVLSVLLFYRRGKSKQRKALKASAQARLAVEPQRDLFDKTQSSVPHEKVSSDRVSQQEHQTPLTHVENVVAPKTQSTKPRELSDALAPTRNSFVGRIKALFGEKPMLSVSETDDLEEILYTSDLGPQTVERLLETVKARLKSSNGSKDFEAVRTALRSEILQIFAELGGDETSSHSDLMNPMAPLNIWTDKPSVIMIVGVNGAGKTTTIGKLASRLAQDGKKVLVAAGDTFRAAAGGQLKVWTERAQVEIFAPENVQDPSAVAFQACERAKSQGMDVVVIDTAGRLHTQKNLMEELKKMKRVIQKVIPSAPHETLLVLDANSGQNALIQAREFNQAIEVTGVVLTKLDGTAKGGVAVGLAHELKLPIRMIGVGEGIDDLRRFSSSEFVDSIL